MTYHAKRYGSYWAVYKDEELKAVTLYKKGALAVTEEFNALVSEIEALKAMKPGQIINDLQEKNRQLRYQALHKAMS